jgi:very-short-patch-repair endonuclease
MKINELSNHELFGGAKPKTFENARKLRKELTECESKLWGLETENYAALSFADNIR